MRLGGCGCTERSPLLACGADRHRQPQSGNQGAQNNPPGSGGVPAADNEADGEGCRQRKRRNRDHGECETEKCCAAANRHPFGYHDYILGAPQIVSGARICTVAARPTLVVAATCGTAAADSALQIQRRMPRRSKRTTKRRRRASTAAKSARVENFSPLEDSFFAAGEAISAGAEEAARLEEAAAARNQPADSWLRRALGSLPLVAPSR